LPRPDGHGDGQWADGYRPSDGAAIDAKHVREQGCSPRTMANLDEDSFASKFMIPKDEDEVADYAAVIENPANHVQYLEIDTNDPETVAYWEYLCAANGLPADVRYVP
jgi:hypothetical protein